MVSLSSRSNCVTLDHSMPFPSTRTQKLGCLCANAIPRRAHRVIIIDSNPNPQSPTLLVTNPHETGQDYGFTSNTILVYCNNNNV